VIRTERTSHGG